MDVRSSTRPLRAVIYARISRDAQADGLGVERQIEDCQTLAQRLGYNVVGVLEDNDISASTRSKKNRPAYNEMLALARAGQVDVILAYSNSRLTRRVREYLDLIDLVVKHGVLIKTAVSGEHDLNTADGRAVALTLATWDQAEAERTSERVKRAKQQMADRGEYRGGRRPYGYEKGGIKLRESEAKFIRQATHDVIAGRSLRGLVKEINEAGAKTSGGRPWTVVELRDVLTRPRNMGYLSHGAVGRKGFEITSTKGIWEPIVDEDTWRAMFAVLTDPSRRTTTSGEAKWLGSGIYRCGVCGGVMRATRSGRYKKMNYRCQENSHILIGLEKTDEFVIGKLMELLDDPRLSEMLSPSAPDLSAEREERSAQEALLLRFERDYAEGNITGAQLRAATERATAKIAELDDQLAKAIQRTASSAILQSANPGEAFKRAPIDSQRAVVARLLRVTINPSPRENVGRSFSTDRIDVTRPTPAT